MIYDAVVLVGPDRHLLAIKAVRSLKVFSKARKIIIITCINNFSLFGNIGSKEVPVILKDEDALLDGMTLSSIKKYLEQRGSSPSRAGWYFQQFLKMGISLQDDIAEHYLIWDSDTIMLYPILFFDEKDDNKVLVKPSTEFHKPYFEVMYRLLGIERSVDFSFISEHMVVKKEYMAELLMTIEKKNRDQNWEWNILDSIDRSYLGRSGFSEFETYGNYIQSKYPKSYKIRPLNSFRRGAKYFGMNPSRFDLYALSKRYGYVTFETKDYRSRAKVALWKTLNLLIYIFDYLLESGMDRFNKQVKAINEI